MISYTKRGCGKVGYEKYQFTITDDNRAIIQINIAQELREVSTTLTEVQLTTEEIELVNAFRKHVGEHSALKTRLGEETEEALEGCEIEFNGITIKEESIMSQFSQLSTIIQGNHAEISPDKIASAYNNSCKKLLRK